IKPIHKPYFNKLGLSFSIPFNKTDVFFDFNSFIYDTRYGFQVSLGTKIRPGKKAAWIPQEENVYYQLFEKRYGVYIGLYKHFRVPKHLNFKHRIVLGVEPSLSFNNFTALSEKQAPTVIISPVAGVHINLASNVNLELSYTYCQLGIININPHRIRVGLNVSFGFRPYKTDFDNYYIIKE
ncbi:MAG: hypothetical protein GX879_01500, partial [Bacteroidales bacterium]|nr:hypothetical protein [Bacteroidales bacterium]